MIIKPTYQIGDRLKYQKKYIGLTVRGVMATSNGYRYFIQVDESDNSFTINSNDMNEMIERCSVDPTDY